ncbi:hypothetical protein H9N25_22280 [Pedobacter riviphilus]|uniref:Uncharacterized protein n=1 Tax=Pedobacter riviphilus TaxID=2766984 RepID=A0ABX6THD6_9SPHI|nr:MULTISPECIES: hypothetical protein [Pedobacter]NII84798.1 hypothetical protein [Pedobacter sp. SG908]NMN38294.1 hypothetical protein [Pedobacter sp. SG918]QNR84591.1 hypothetical protein H9N25_22280 [Pedobacter riviphilus]
MKPLDFSQDGDISVLEAEVSGTFDGSPAILKYNMELKNGLLQLLKIQAEPNKQVARWYFCPLK